MHWTIEKNETPEFLRVVTFGTFSADDLRQMFAEIFTHPSWRQGIAVLIDNRKIDVAEVSTPEILESADNLVRFNYQFNFSRVAVIYNSPESLEAADSFGRITETRTTARVKRFLEEEPALKWLCPESANAKGR